MPKGRDINRATFLLSSTWIYQMLPRAFLGGVYEHMLHCTHFSGRRTSRDLSQPALRVRAATKYSALSSQGKTVRSE